MRTRTREGGVAPLTPCQRWVYVSGRSYAPLCVHPSLCIALGEGSHTVVCHELDVGGHVQDAGGQPLLDEALLFLMGCTACGCVVSTAARFAMSAAAAEGERKEERAMCPVRMRERESKQENDEQEPGGAASQ